MKALFGIVALLVATPSVAQSTAQAMEAPVTAASPAATEIAAKLFPDGTYRKLLGPAMTQMMSGMTDGAAAMPMGPLLRAAGLPEKDATKLDKATVGEIMAILDPAYKERMHRMMDGMFAAMIPVFEKMEPDLRAGLALSLQSRFTSAQLEDLRAFFKTSTGDAYASQQMLLFMDPAVMGRMQSAMPKVMAALPSIIGQAVKDTADLPKAKTYKDLNDAEREKLAKLLGVDPARMKP